MGSIAGLRGWPPERGFGSGKSRSVIIRGGSDVHITGHGIGSSRAVPPSGACVNPRSAAFMSLPLVGQAFGAETIWVAIGWMGQAMFFLRFLVQWIVSERRHPSVIPVAFWY